MTVRPTVDGLADALDTNWQCVQSAIDDNGSEIIERSVVTDKVTVSSKEYFNVVLAPAMTDQVPVLGLYKDLTWVVKVWNSSIIPAYEKTITESLRIYPPKLP